MSRSTYGSVDKTVALELLRFGPHVSLASLGIWDACGEQHSDRSATSKQLHVPSEPIPKPWPWIARYLFWEACFYFWEACSCFGKRAHVLGSVLDHVLGSMLIFWESVVWPWMARVR